MSQLTIDRFAGREASVNAYIIHNGTHAVVIDSLRNREEAVALADEIRRSGRELQAILVTHGHPDHYIGLRSLKEAFPRARILVATSEVKADILAFSHWMESVGWLESQAQMKPKGPSAPDGFDYDREIEVLATSRFELIGGGVLEVTTEYPETECSHMSTVFLPSENALLTSDLVYHGVHAWAGQGVQREHIANWSKVLTELKGRYAKPGLKVYPGHGAPGDASLFDAMKAYLDELVDTVRTARTNAEALQRMKGRYPSFEQEDFLLAHTIAFHGPDGRP